MRVKRFFRDFAVLLLFCGAFYLLTSVLSRLDSETVDDSDFSDERKRADVSMKKQDWEAASVDYLALTEKDPYNGHAWYRSGSSFNFQREHLFLRMRAVRADARDQQEGSGAEDMAPETIELLEELQAELDDLSEKAKDAFKKSKEFARYRADSLLKLAAIESYQGNNAQSLGYLEEFVENGSYTQRGLAHYRVFGSGGSIFTSPTAILDGYPIRLHAEPKFWEIVRKEGFNHSR